MEREDQIIDVPLGSVSSGDEARNNQVDTQFTLNQLIYKNRWTIGFLLFGLLLLGIGVLSVKSFPLLKDETKIEVLSGGEIGSVEGGADVTKAENGLTVEISGEVVKPGVYRLVSGSRVGDLLIKAEGLSSLADRDWVAKNINQAQKLVDGQKIYVPKTGEVRGAKTEAGGEIGSGADAIASKININQATKEELDKLPGVGPVTADKIITGRPYQNNEDLLRKKAVNAGVWEKIKDLITVW